MALIFYFCCSVRYFGLQHYGECWSGKNADITYARDGSSDACVNGVGKKGANFVYKFLNTIDQSKYIILIIIIFITVSSSSFLLHYIFIHIKVCVAFALHLFTFIFGQFSLQFLPKICTNVRLASNIWLSIGCDMGWHSTKDLCYQISANVTPTLDLANEYCARHLGSFYLANTSNDISSLDRFIVTLDLNEQLNTTNCIVLKDNIIPYGGILTSWNSSMPPLAGGLIANSLGTGYECAVKDVNGKWYHLNCDLKTCKILCSKNRGNIKG